VSLRTFIHLLEASQERHHLFGHGQNSAIQSCANLHRSNGSGTIDKANVTNVVVSCAHTGRFAYVANQLSNDVSAYAIDSATGNLFAINGSPFAVSGTTPASLAVDPNGLFLYVVNNGSDTVSVYTIDNTTGALHRHGISAPTGSGPDGLAVDPTDRFLYVANLASNSVSAYAIDTSTGLLTQLSNSPFRIGATPVPCRSIRAAVFSMSPTSPAAESLHW